MKIADSIAIAGIAVILAVVMTLVGAASLSFSFIGLLITIIVAFSSVEDFVEVAFDKNANGYVSKSFFKKMYILVIFAILAVMTTVNPVITGIGALIIYSL